MPIEMYTTKFELKAVEEWLVRYTNSNKSYRVVVSVTRRVMESRNHVFIETPPLGIRSKTDMQGHI